VHPLVFALLGLAALDAGDLASARRPPRPDQWWTGLERAEAQAPARGVVALRVPPAARVHVSAARFVMGSTAAEMAYALELCKREMRGALCQREGFEFRSEGHAHEVTLSAYEIDRTEVTVGVYARCVAAGACDASRVPAGDPRFDRPSLPVTHVTWADAAGFCAWAGGRLPTEAEWELAARGSTGRAYPWGNVYNPRLCNHGAFAPDETDATDGFVWLAPAGSLPDGNTPAGVADMAGNAAEWVADFYEVDADGHGYPDGPVVDPRGPLSGAYHVVRGGSYLAGAAWVRAAARSTIINPRAAHVGFRCAYDVR
jgi:formylglycine-generating enzyme required for sulfatase activity